MSLFSKTTMGLIKAMTKLAEEPARQEQKRAARPKFAYKDFATAVHGKRYIKPAERKVITALIEQIKEAESDEVRGVLVGKLQRQPVHFFKVKIEEHIDYGRYTGQDIREINAAGGGRKERARAEKRRAAMVPMALAA